MCVEAMTSVHLLQDADWSDVLRRRLHELWQLSAFCDVSLLAASDGGQVTAHAVVLTALCGDRWRAGARPGAGGVSVPVVIGVSRATLVAAVRRLYDGGAGTGRSVADEPAAGAAAGGQAGVTLDALTPSAAATGQTLSAALDGLRRADQLCDVLLGGHWAHRCVVAAASTVLQRALVLCDACDIDVAGIRRETWPDILRVRTEQSRRTSNSRVLEFYLQNVLEFYLQYVL